MKLSEFRSNLSERFDLLRANLWFTFQQELAYAGNNWAGLFSTTFYTVSMLLFLNIIFSNVKTLAGYTQQEILFFFLVSQFSYYLNWIVTLKNVYELIVDVNKGNLDMVLTKPVPALFYLFTRRINILSMLKEGLPPTLAVVVFIKWGELSFEPVNLLIGTCVFLLGLWILHVVTFISALPVFWLGESTSIVDLTLQMASGNGVLIPFEGYSRSMQIIFGSVLPVFISTAYATSAMLGKTNPWLLLYWTAVIATIATVLRIKLWNIAIKNYTSASS